MTHKNIQEAYLSGVQRGIEFAVDEMLSSIISIKYHDDAHTKICEFLKLEYERKEKERDSYNGN